MKEKQSKKMSVLVTGAGGQLGQSIIKSLRFSKLSVRIVGTDCDARAAGMYRVDCAYIVPRAYQANQSGYISAIQKIIKDEQVSIMFVGSDDEVSVLAYQKKAIEEAGTRLVISSPEAISIASDKWNTVQFLKNNGLEYPETARADDVEAVEQLVHDKGFPVIVKSRSGSGSKMVRKANDKIELICFTAAMPNAIVQEMLLPDDEEYTYGAYYDNMIRGSMLLRRELMGGLTGKAEVSDNSRIISYAEAIIKALKPFGPCNIQLRLTSRGPVAFEINPRFSSTSIIQAKFGFNAAEMALRSIALKEQNVQVNEIHKNLIAMRFYEEMYVTQEQCRKLQETKRLEKPSGKIDRLL